MLRNELIEKKKLYTYTYSIKQKLNLFYYSTIFKSYVGCY